MKVFFGCPCARHCTGTGRGGYSGSTVVVVPPLLGALPTRWGLEFPHMQSPEPVSWLVTQTPVSCVKEHRREGRRGCEWFSARSPTPTFWKNESLACGFFSREG